MKSIREFARIPEEKKLLLMPRYVKENEVLSHICGEVGSTTVNLEITSLLDLAQECYLWQQTMRGESARPFVREQGTLLVMSILQDLSAKKKLAFFKPEWIDAPTCEEIFQNINLCRKYRVGPKELRQSATGGGKEAAKLADLAKVLERYETAGAMRDYIDETALYQSVITAAADGETLPPTMRYDRIGMEEGDYNALSPVERDFLGMFLRASGVDDGMPELLADDAETLSATAEKASERTFFSGYGLVNEVSCAAEKILRRGWRFDDVTVLCPDESYIAAVAEQFQEWGIPAVCNGIAIRHSSTVEILERLYRYVSGEYDRSLFVELAQTDGVTVPVAEGEEIDRREREERLFQKIKTICPKNAQDEIEVCRAASDLRDFLTRYTYVKNAPMQQIAYGAVLSMLSGYEKISGRRMPYERAVKWFFEQAASLTATAEFALEKGECAKVQVRTLAALRFINTKVVFALGMTAGSFMTAEHDSPVLSDEERGALGIRELKRERSAGILRRFQYALALHDTEGREQFFGYNAYALDNLTEQVPCLMYRVLREQCEQAGRGKEPERYDFLQRQSFARYFAKKDHADEDVRTTVADLIRPQVGKGRTQYTLSATGLGALVVCPMKYYLQHELRLAEPEEPFIQPDEWLSAAEKGTVIHAVLEEYVNRVYLQAQVADGAKREEIMDAVLEKAMERMRDYRPCTDYLYRREKKQAREALQAYLGQIEEDGFVPVHTEYAIGKVSAREHQDADEIEIPVSADGSAVGTIVLNGVIDRIDRRGAAEDGAPAEYRIIDYKTGKKPKVGETPFDFIVQDYLYARAWEKIMERQNLPGKVTGAVYEYIFLAGDGGHERLRRASADWQAAEKHVAGVLARVRQDGFISYRKLWEQDALMLGAAEASAAVGYCPYAGFCPAAEKEHCGKGAARKW